MRLNARRGLIVGSGLFVAVLCTFWYIRAHPSEVVGTWTSKESGKFHKILTLRPGGHGYIRFVGIPLTEQSVSWSADGDKITIDFDDVYVAQMLEMHSSQMMVTNVDHGKELDLDIDGQITPLYPDR